MAVDTMNYDPVDGLEAIRTALHATFNSNVTKPLNFRRHQLLQLARLIQNHSEDLAEALYLDLGRPRLESYMGDIGGMMQRVLITTEKLEEWAKDEDMSGKVQEWQRNWKCRIRQEPKGVVLIISPWNYPVILFLQPLCGAIAAGCCAVVKTSEISPHCSTLLAKLIPRYLDQRAYRVVQGGVHHISKLLEFQWDHIFYTGNGRIARIIGGAALKHLTPVTLELGGKSPVIIDCKCDINLAAKRILWGKINNAGQICVAPDYVLCPRSVLSEFVSCLSTHLKAFFPDGALKSNSYSRIVSEEHFQRIKSLLENTKGKVLLGGALDSDEVEGRIHEGRKGIEPTVVLTEEGDVLLEDELFGPILPIVAVDDVDEAIRFINTRDHALVLYAFSEDDDVKEHILARTMSGAVHFNDTFSQLSILQLPLGGVGGSGYGRQGLKYSFDLFRYERPVSDVPKETEPMLADRYPPYTPEALAFFSMSTHAKIPESSAPADLQNIEVDGKDHGNQSVPFVIYAN